MPSYRGAFGSVEVVSLLVLSSVVFFHDLDRMWTVRTKSKLLLDRSSIEDIC